MGNACWQSCVVSFDVCSVYFSFACNVFCALGSPVLLSVIPCFFFLCDL